MFRALMWIIAGGVLGIVVHLVTILSLPSLASESVWDRVLSLDSFEKIVVLDDVSYSSPNPLQLDPELLYGICRLDLNNGVGVLSAQMPSDFWSVSVFDAQGVAVYGTTNRSIVGQSLKLGIFNDEQIKMLSDQELNIEEGLLIVESELNDVFVVLRVAPPHPALKQRYREQLEKAVCASN
ncbi:MAG: hypothetical protein L3J21_00810 [Devosiaceae bacterium]|nr:hypothetical protein [Devosiaceae bacterium]